MKVTVCCPTSPAPGVQLKTELMGFPAAGNAAVRLAPAGKTGASKVTISAASASEVTTTVMLSLAADYRSITYCALALIMSLKQGLGLGISGESHVGSGPKTLDFVPINRASNPIYGRGEIRS